MFGGRGWRKAGQYGNTLRVFSRRSKSSVGKTGNLNGCSLERTLGRKVVLDTVIRPIVTIGPQVLADSISHGLPLTLSELEYLCDEDDDGGG